MTAKNDEIQRVEKLVVVVDICSSTKILEDLLRTNSEGHWRDLLISLKNHLRGKEQECGFELYKFLGDGWILLFDPAREKSSVSNVVPVMRRLVQHFDQEYRRLIRDRLESRPDAEGLTFGLDCGRLIRVFMSGRHEYIGRPINVASRLQSAVKDKGDKPQGNALVTNKLFVDLKKYANQYQCTRVSRDLRNLAVPTLTCWKITLSKVLLRVRR